jgi:hypothetical protein
MGERVDAVAILAMVILKVAIGLVTGGKAALKSPGPIETPTRHGRTRRDPSSRPIGARTLDREASRLIVV